MLSKLITLAVALAAPAWAFRHVTPENKTKDGDADAAGTGEITAMMPLGQHLAGKPHAVALSELEGSQNRTQIWDWLGDVANTVVGVFVQGATNEVLKDVDMDDGSPVGDLKHDVITAEPHVIGAVFNEMAKERIWEEITNHKVEICFLTFDKKGFKAEMAKCNFGVSCDDCKYFKVELRATVDFCNGFKFGVKAEFAVIAPTFTGRLSVTDIMQMVIDHIPPEVIPGVQQASALAGLVMELITENSGGDHYPKDLKVDFYVNFHYELANGVGAGLDVKLGYDLCDPDPKEKFYCFGADIGIGAIGKIGVKLFVCLNPEGAIKVEIGAGPFTGVLELGFAGGLEPEEFTLAPTWSTIGAYTESELCMSTPSWKSQQQRVDDGDCPQKSSSDCSKASHCYWDLPSDRKSFCFATKSWKTKYPSHGDGWCVFLSSKNACEDYPHCVWSKQPCELSGTDCKDPARVNHDLQLWSSQKVCMAEPSWKSQQQTADDGLCVFHTSQQACSKWPCYWGTRAQRKFFCFATVAWKQSHPGQGDGLFVFHNTEEKCANAAGATWLASPNHSNFEGDCRWSTEPCTEAGNCNQWSWHEAQTFFRL